MSPTHVVIGTPAARTRRRHPTRPAALRRTFRASRRRATTPDRYIAEPVHDDEPLNEEEDDDIVLDDDEEEDDDDWNDDLPMEDDDDGPFVPIEDDSVQT